MIGRVLLSVSAAAMLACCGPEIPEIARDLPSNYADGQAVFDARLKARFPVGTREEALLGALRKQGFPMPPFRGPDGIGSATFTRDELVSRTIWSVRWRARDGRVAEIWGVYGVQAP